MDDDLLKYLTERADQEHRTLSNMIISMLLTNKENDSNNVRKAVIELHRLASDAYKHAEANVDNNENIAFAQGIEAALGVIKKHTNV